MIGNSQGRKPRISIIVAMAKNRVIGANNALPWHLSSDLKRFKALTMGHHIIMGRKTFESIGRILPGRTNVVITRNESYRHAGLIIAHSLTDALALCAGDDELFVIGGEQLYREALRLADRVYLTSIDKEFEGDSFFPEIEHAAWRSISQEKFRDETAGFAYTLSTLDRTNAAQPSMHPRRK
jgi:dihydrofolate reductase